MQRNKSLFNANLIYFILIFLFCTVRLLWSTGWMKFLGDTSSYVFALIVQVGIMFVLPLCLFSMMQKQSARQTLKDFSFKKINSQSIWLSIIIGIVVFILNIFVASFFSFILSLFGYNPSSSSSTMDASWWLFVIEAISVAVLPGFCEEFVHRGLLIKGYYNLGIKRAVIYSSILFGLMHLNVGQFFFASIIGIVLGLVTVLTGSIYPAMIIHFMNNFINRYLSFAGVLDWPLGNFYKFIDNAIASTSPIIAMIMIFAIIIILLRILYVAVTMLFKINAINSVQEFANKVTIIQLRKDVLEGIEVESQHNKEELKNEIPIELLGIPLRPTIKPTIMDNVFFYSSLFLGGLITIFTFVWGVL